jgi:hypothetical protein
VIPDFFYVPLVAAEAEPLVRKLDPVLRAQVLMALLGLVLIGLVLILLVLMGGRYVRRLARHRPGTPAADVQDDWYRKPLVQENPEPDDEQ